MENKFTYRAGIQIMFNGILALLGLLFVLYLYGINVLDITVSDGKLVTYIIENEVLMSVIILPICFVLGQTVIAVDYLVFILCNPKKCRLKFFYSRCIIVNYVFWMFYGCRKYGQKLYFFRNELRAEHASLENHLEDIVEDTQTFLDNNKKQTENKNAPRYSTFSDFYKGFCMTTFCIMVAMMIKHEWVWFGVFLFVWLCALLRQWFYSQLWVKAVYKKA